VLGLRGHTRTRHRSTGAQQPGCHAGPRGLDRRRVPEALV